MLNGDRFVCLNNAISNVTGSTFTVTEVNYHASWSLDSVSAGGGGFELTTIKIDDIVGAHLTQGVERIVLKLDVEGYETRALDGAAKTLREKDVMVIYEDHGSDSTCSNTAYMFASGFNVFYVSDEGSVRQMKSLADVSSVKRNHERGYNFAAAKRGGSFDRRAAEWIARGCVDSPEQEAGGCGTGVGEPARC